MECVYSSCSYLAIGTHFHFEFVVELFTPYIFGRTFIKSVLEPILLCITLLYPSLINVAYESVFKISVLEVVKCVSVLSICISSVLSIYQSFSYQFFKSENIYQSLTSVLRFKNNISFKSFL